MLNQISVQVKLEGLLLEKKSQLSPAELAERLPQYSSVGNAAFDLRLALEAPLTLKPNESKVIGVGYGVWIQDPNFVGYVVPRSGLGSKGLVVGNLVGVIDSNYQGELKVCVWNRSNEDKIIEPWDRVAQFIISPVYHAQFDLVENYHESSDRGADGFNSSGVK